jgi:hypothetical protein
MVVDSEVIKVKPNKARDTYTNALSGIKLV